MFIREMGDTEKMTDAEMKSRFDMLKSKKTWIDKYIPWIAGSIIGGAVLATGIAFLVTGAAPLVAMSAVVGIGSVTLGFGGIAKSEIDDQIFRLSAENRTRVEIAQWNAERHNRKIPESTLNLRKAFDEVGAKMRAGTDRDIVAHKRFRVRPSSIKAELTA